MNNQDSPFSISTELKRGWELFKNNWLFLLSYQIILSIILVIQASSERHLWHFLFWILYIIAQMGFYKSALLITSGVKPELNQLYDNWNLLISWIVANILFYIIFTIGLVFLIIPGLYFWARFGLFPYFLLDKRIGPIASLEQASEATTGIRWNIFLLFISCVLLNFIGLLIFGIGIFITAPVTVLAIASVYQQIKHKVMT